MLPCRRHTSYQGYVLIMRRSVVAVYANPSSSGRQESRPTSVRDCSKTGSRDINRGYGLQSPQPIFVCNDLRCSFKDRSSVGFFYAGLAMSIEIGAQSYSSNAPLQSVVPWSAILYSLDHSDFRRGPLALHRTAPYQSYEKSDSQFS